LQPAQPSSQQASNADQYRMMSSYQFQTGPESYDQPRLAEWNAAQASFFDQYVDPQYSQDMYYNTRAAPPKGNGRQSGPRPTTQPVLPAPGQLPPQTQPQQQQPLQNQARYGHGRTGPGAGGSRGKDSPKDTSAKTGVDVPTMSVGASAVPAVGPGPAGVAPTSDATGGNGARLKRDSFPPSNKTAPAAQQGGVPQFQFNKGPPKQQQPLQQQPAPYKAPQAYGTTGYIAPQPVVNNYGDPNGDNRSPRSAGSGGSGTAGGFKQQQQPASQSQGTYAKQFTPPQQQPGAGAPVFSAAAQYPPHMAGPMYQPAYPFYMAPHPYSYPQSAAFAPPGFQSRPGGYYSSQAGYDPAYSSFPGGYGPVSPNFEGEFPAEEDFNGALNPQKEFDYSAQSKGATKPVATEGKLASTSLTGTPPAAGAATKGKASKGGAGDVGVPYSFQQPDVSMQQSFGFSIPPQPMMYDPSLRFPTWQQPQQ